MPPDAAAIPPNYCWSGSREALTARFREVRGLTGKLVAPLSAEDMQIQSMTDVSPSKWHIAHITWFFEAFILTKFDTGYRVFHPDYGYLFNSYYEAIGPRHERPRRGLISRPPATDIMAYRAHVDAAVANLIETASGNVWKEICGLIELGLNHEQQHQELLLMDIKHVLSCNPMHPAYDDTLPDGAKQNGKGETMPLGWHDYEGGLVEIGHDVEAGVFAYDNEGPRHKAYLAPYRLASRLITNGEYRDFIADGGYREARHWLADGWGAVQEEGWQAPLYWRANEDNGADGDFHEFTLAGLRPLDAAAPVTHLSLYEADAYASWAGKRLPTESEWENAAETSLNGNDIEDGANLLQTGRLHPAPAPSNGKGTASGAVPNNNVAQLIGDCWEFTSSHYGAYPGFKAPPGAVGEYNGKFMSGQMVLRGGCAVTPPGHVRTTYRNFFYPHMRWMFGGVRLAEDV